MSRDEAAAALLRDAQGLDGGSGFDPEGPEFSFGADDPMSRAGLTTLSASIEVANAAALDLDLFDQAHLDNVALPTGLVSIGSGSTIADYKQVLRYFQSNPSQVRSMLITSSETSTDAPLLAGMTITPTRNNPFGVSMSNQRLVRSVQTTADFQANRVTFPISLALDTITFMNLATETNNSGSTVTFNIAFMIGRRAEVRRTIAPAKPLVIRPGGRGPAPV